MSETGGISMKMIKETKKQIGLEGTIRTGNTIGGIGMVKHE